MAPLAGKAGEIRQSVEREIHLSRRARETCSAALRRRTRPGSSRGSRNFVKVRRGSTDDDTIEAFDFVAVVEDDAGRAPVAGEDSADGRLRANLDTRLARRGRNGIRDRAGAPLGESPRSERPVDFAHVVMEQHVRRARRAHTLKRADDARCRHRRLQHVGLEPLIEKIGRAHRHQLHEPVARFGRHRLEAAAEPEELAQVGRRERQRIGRADVERRLDEARHVDHRLAVLVVGLGIDA